MSVYVLKMINGITCKLHVGTQLFLGILESHVILLDFCKLILHHYFSTIQPQNRAEFFQGSSHCENEASAPPPTLKQVYSLVQNGGGRLL